MESTRPTTHSDPTYIYKGIVHYCVTNMPGAVAHTSTFGLVNATLPYMLDLADKGWERAVRESPALMRGLNLTGGKVYCAGVSETFGWETESFGRLGPVA